MKHTIKKAISAVLIIAVLAAIGAPAFAADSDIVPISIAITSRFSDVADSHWALANIGNCVTKGIMNGVGGGEFKPEATLTRAQVAQICYNAYGGRLTGVKGVEMGDVAEGAWYRDAVVWMAANGFAGGTSSDGKIYYNPDAVADRKHVADILYRLSYKLQATLPQNVEAIEFSDLVDLEASYVEAINALQRTGVIGGFPDGTFRPNDSLTRAQAAKIFDLVTDIRGLTPAPAPDKDETNDGGGANNETGEADVAAQNAIMALLFVSSVAEQLGYTVGQPQMGAVAAGAQAAVLLTRGNVAVRVIVTVASIGPVTPIFSYTAIYTVTGLPIGSASGIEGTDNFAKVLASIPAM